MSSGHENTDRRECVFYDRERHSVDGKFISDAGLEWSNVALPEGKGANAKRNWKQMWKRVRLLRGFSQYNGSTLD